MKKLVLSVAACTLLVPGFAAAKDKSFSGEIMDSQCAKNASHEAMLKKEGMENMKDDPKAKQMCTINCVKMGGKYVLFDAASKTVYQLDDQTKPEQFAGQKVKVTGTLDKAAKTIHVTGIKAAQ